MSLLRFASTVSTLHDHAVPVGTTTPLLGDGVRRPYIEWARADANGTTDVSIKIGNIVHVLDSTGAGTWTSLPGPVVGRAGEGISIVVTGSGAAKVEMTFGFMGGAGSVGDDQTSSS